MAVSSFDMGSAQVPQDSGRDRRRPADICDRYVDLRLDNGLEPRRFSRKTDLHKFVTSPSGASSYKGSGEVPGTLLNQYAMSEYKGVLRVASTISERRGWVNSRQSTEGLVTTLHEQDGALANWGRSAGWVGRTTNRFERCGSSRSAGTS